MAFKFDSYLIDLALDPIQRKRVEEIYTFYNAQLGVKKIDDIFISEYYNKEGIREFESLWFFSTEYIMEAKEFLYNDDFDLVAISKSVSHLRIRKKHFDMINVNENSTLKIDVIIHNSGIGMILNGSRKNCLNLITIFKKYILKSIIK